MLYIRLLTCNKLFSNPITAILTKLGYDTIFYGNKTSSQIMTLIMCYFGAVKISEIGWSLLKDIRLPTITFSKTVDAPLQITTNDGSIEEVNYDDLMDDINGVLQSSRNMTHRNN